MLSEWISNLRLRMATLFHRRQLDQDLDDEVAFHLAMREEKLRASGGSARKQFGNATAIKETARELWTFPALESVWSDLRYGARVLRQSPLFTGVAVLSLALGIGANTAVFTLINAVMFEKLPVPAPEELVVAGWFGRANGMNFTNSYSMSYTDPDTGRGYTSTFFYRAFDGFRNQATQFSELFAFTGLPRAAFRVHGQTNLLPGMLVSGDYFSGLGVEPLVGRLLNDADDQPNAEPVAVISYQLWRDAFGSDPRAIGASATLNGVPVTVVGVTPPSFYGVSPGGFIPSPDVTVALHLAPAVVPWFAHHNSSVFLDDGLWWLTVMGRMLPGTTRVAAEAELNGLFRQAMDDGTLQVPTDGTAPALGLMSGAQGFGNFRSRAAVPLWLLLAVAALVLLIACANVAMLMLARAAARRGEITVRLAMGAGRARLVRQLLTESMLLSVAAGVLGVLVAWWGSRILVSWAVEMHGPLRAPFELDIRVLGFAAGLSLITGVLFGLAPAFRASSVNLVPSLKEGAGIGRSASGPAGHSGRLGQGLIAVQVALSLVLVVGAGLFVQTLRNLRGVELGFRSEGLLLFGIDPSLNQHEGDRLAGLYRDLTVRLENTPGILSATASSLRLITGWVTNGPARIPAATALPDGNLQSHYNYIGPHFFETMGIPVLLGRGPLARDTADSPRVAFVNEAVVQAAFPDRSPLGAIVFPSGSEERFEIAGVVANAHYARVKQDPPPTIYIPYEQAPGGISRSLHFAVRTAGPPEAFAGAVRALVRELDPGLPLIDVKTQRRVIDEQLGEERLFASLSAAFGVLAMLLACIGIYGVVACAAARRTGEIGIRIALGARHEQILWLMLRRTMALVALGVAVGTGGALALTRLIESRLWQVTPDDPATFASAAALLILVALVAGILPANRAARIHPIEALRSE
jgi:predicted permease